MEDEKKWNLKKYKTIMIQRKELGDISSWILAFNWKHIP